MEWYDASMKQKVLTSMGDVLVSRVRKTACASEGCPWKTRLALVVPCSDLVLEDGTVGVGLGAVALCGGCLEDAVVAYLKATR